RTGRNLHRSLRSGRDRLDSDPGVLRCQMWATVLWIEAYSRQPKHRLGKFADGRVTLTVHQQQAVARRTERHGWGDGRVKNIEHLRGRLLVGYLGKPDDRNQW